MGPVPVPSPCCLHFCRSLVASRSPAAGAAAARQAAPHPTGPMPAGVPRSSLRPLLPHRRVPSPVVAQAAQQALGLAQLFPVGKLSCSCAPGLDLCRLVKSANGARAGWASQAHTSGSHSRPLSAHPHLSVPRLPRPTTHAHFSSTGTRAPRPAFPVRSDRCLSPPCNQLATAAGAVTHLGHRPGSVTLAS